jgi:hypothetical protein
MNKTEALRRVRDVCRVRRLSRHTEDCYAQWVGRFIAHIRQCREMNREERVASFLHGLASRITSPLDAAADRRVVPFVPVPVTETTALRRIHA